MNHSTYEGGLKYRPDYEWPEPGTDRKLSKVGDILEIIENKPNYYGKPWWCYKCQWQFSEEDLSQVELDSKEEE